MNIDNPTHAQLVESMHNHGPDHRGRYLDPVSGRWFPRGQAMVRNPSREERRRLARWRRTGKCAGHPVCPRDPDAVAAAAAADPLYRTAL